MTTPRPHADLAARYFADDTLKCWARNKGSNYDWLLLHAPAFKALDLEYYVGHEPPPIKCTINLPAATIDTLRAQLAEAQKDEERLDWMIEQCAYVVSDPDCCDGYWLNYLRPDGTLWVQTTEHETPRAAIDAAKGESNE